jgi:hypothetical protein
MGRSRPAAWNPPSDQVNTSPPIRSWRALGIRDGKCDMVVNPAGSYRYGKAIAVITLQPQQGL